MDPSGTLVLAALFFAIAVLYTTVGHAGASGYLAAMALMGTAPEAMRPTALVLNVAVAAFTTWRFREARYFDARALMPFVLGSLPFALLGGYLKLPVAGYQALVGAVLLVSAALLVWRSTSPRFAGHDGPVRIPRLPAIAIGMAIGLLSGLTGTGGGIFLSPVILLLGWAGPRITAGISAPFIMVNSLAGLAGGSLAAHQLPEQLFLFVACVLAGAFAGTWLGIRKLSTRALIITLAVVMVTAGTKLVARAL